MQALSTEEELNPWKQVRARSEKCQCENRRGTGHVSEDLRKERKGPQSQVGWGREKKPGECGSRSHRKSVL